MSADYQSRAYESTKVRGYEGTENTGFERRWVRDWLLAHSYFRTVERSSSVWPYTLLVAWRMTR